MKPVKLLFNKDFKGTPNKPQDIVAYIYKKQEVKSGGKTITYFRGLTQAHNEAGHVEDLHFSLTLPEKPEHLANFNIVLRKNYKILGSMQAKGTTMKDGTPVVNYRLWVDAIELLPDLPLEQPHE